MTNEEQRFFEMMDKSSLSENTKKIWDRENLTVELPKVREALGYLSTGEAILLQFFTMLWCGGSWGNESYAQATDIFTLASKLDSDNKQIILEWFDAPFWP